MNKLAVVASLVCLQVADCLPDSKVCKECNYDNPYDVRLTGGPNLWTGSLEVCMSGEWRRWCGPVVFIDVICRQLGYDEGYGLGTDFLYREPEVHSFTQLYLDCNGNENSIAECNPSIHGWDVGCILRHEAISCENSDTKNEGKVQLINGTSQYDGKPEIFHLGEWKAVCDVIWTAQDAEVICRQLGYSGGQVEAEETQENRCDPPGWLNRFFCRGLEGRITECPWADYGVVTFTPYHATINCEPDTDSSIVRLVSGKTSSEGRLEVKVQGQWTTVCDKQFGDLEAQVVCSELGFSGGVALERAYFGQGAEQQQQTSYTCTGNEESIFDCSSHNVVVSGCWHHRDVGVMCDPQP